MTDNVQRRGVRAYEEELLERYAQPHPSAAGMYWYRSPLDGRLHTREEMLRRIHMLIGLGLVPKAGYPDEVVLRLYERLLELEKALEALRLKV